MAPTPIPACAAVPRPDDEGVSEGALVGVAQLPVAQSGMPAELEVELGP